MEHENHIHLNLTEFLKHLTDKAMATFQNIVDQAAVDRQKFLDALAAKDAQITSLTNENTDLKNQLANVITPEQGDQIITAMDGIVANP